jgi:dTDP-4-amino-4,6-dideoxygalactose transaminase
MKIPIASPHLGSEEQKAVQDVLSSNNIAHGKTVEAFEKQFASFIGTEYGITTNNGTTALHTALVAHDIGPGDEVITTPFSFIATGNCIRYVGATPVFVDIKDDFNIDPKRIEEAITEKTKALIVVHLYGLPCDMDEIMEIVAEHDLVLIEDCAQAHGASFEGRNVGSYGTACFSFYPTKNMTTSEGGMITTNNGEIAQRAAMIRNHGMKVRYHHEMEGYNYRMTNIAAAIGIEQLKKLPSFNEARIRNASLLTEGLNTIEQVTCPSCPSNKRHVYHQYTIRAENRDELAMFLNENGIGTGIYYPIPITGQQGFSTTNTIENTLTACLEVLSLPVHPSVDKDDIAYITAKIGEFYD